VKFEGTKVEIDPEAKRPFSVFEPEITEIEWLKILIVEPGTTYIEEETSSDPPEGETDGEANLVDQGEAQLKVGEEGSVPREREVGIAAEGIGAAEIEDLWTLAKTHPSK